MHFSIESSKNGRKSVGINARLVKLVPSFAFAKLTFPGGHSSSEKSFYSAIAVKGGMGESVAQDADLVESRDLYRYGADFTIGLQWGAVL